MTTRFRFALALAGAFALAGCSGGEENETPVENVEVNSFEPVNDTLPADAPTAEANMAASNAAADAAPAIPDDVQVREDAEAAGMTARVDRDEMAAANDSAPAE